MYKIPSLIFCMEMPEVSLGVKLLQLKYDLVPNEIQFSDALIYSLELEDIPLYFGYSARITPEVYYNTLKEARNRYRDCHKWIAFGSKEARSAP